jgi:hypothetical protein
MLLSAMTMRGWEAGAGDNDLLGWATTIAYFVAAGFCLWAWRAERGATSPTRRPKFWLIMCILLALLGLNKQLDMQLWLAGFVKQYLVRDGARRDWLRLNKVFLAGLALFAVTAFALLIRYIGAAWRRYWLPLTGLTYLALFILVRAGMNIPRIEAVNMNFYQALHDMEFWTLVLLALCAAHAAITARRLPASPLPAAAPPTATASVARPPN